MTPPDYDDLLRRLRIRCPIDCGADGAIYGTERDAAADAIEALREQVAAKDAEIIASYDRAARLVGWHEEEVERADKSESERNTYEVAARSWELRAEKAEADNAALRQRLARLRGDDYPNGCTPEGLKGKRRHARGEGEAMTPPDYDDLCKRLRNGFPDVYEWEQAADAIAALRSENARLLQEVLSPGTIPFNWQERAEKAEADNAALREVCIDVLAHLVAAHSLLVGGGKKAAPSDKMFDQMLKDYAASIARGRAALREGKEKP